MSWVAKSALSCLWVSCVITLIFSSSLDQLGLIMQAKGLQSVYRAFVMYFFIPSLDQINQCLISTLSVCVCVYVSLSGTLNWSGFNAVGGSLSRGGHVGVNHITFCFLATNPVHWSDESFFSVDVTWRPPLSLSEQKVCQPYFLSDVCIGFKCADCSSSFQLF